MSNDNDANAIVDLQMKGLPVRPYIMTKRNKHEVINALIAEMKQGEITLPSNIAFRDELKLAIALGWMGVRHAGSVVKFE